MNVPIKSGFSTRSLTKAIFAADFPDSLIRQIPSQSLFMIVKENGLESSGDLISMASVRQCRLLMDFDLWRKDTFNEENFWKWLSLTSDEDPLVLQQKLLTFVDLKFIAILIAKYIKIVIMDEPTEHPPTAEYFTPDKGYTWLYLDIEDADKHFLLGRLMALIFETDVELFYQIISIPNVSTIPELEEMSYQEKIKRLADEGIPEPELAHEINSPILESEINKLLEEKGTNHHFSQDIVPIEPLIYDSQILQPLGSLLSEPRIRDDVLSELTLILNSAFTHFGVNFDETDEIRLLSEQVKGALNIGLELILNKKDMPLEELYNVIGLQKIYRFGLNKLFKLRKDALSKKGQPELDAAELAMLDALTRPFPAMLEDSTPNEIGQIKPDLKAIEKLLEFEELHKNLI